MYVHTYLPITKCTYLFSNNICSEHVKSLTVPSFYKMLQPGMYLYIPFTVSLIFCNVSDLNELQSSICISNSMHIFLKIVHISTNDNIGTYYLGTSPLRCLLYSPSSFFFKSSSAFKLGLLFIDWRLADTPFTLIKSMLFLLNLICQWINSFV